MRNLLIVVGALIFGVAVANTHLTHSAMAQDAAASAPAVQASPSPSPSPSPSIVVSNLAAPAVAAPDGGWLPWVFGALFALSELLAQIPAVKANSVFELVAGILKALAGKK